MSHQDPTIPYAVPPTMVEYEPLPPPPADDYIDDEDEDWVSKAPKGLRIPPLIGVMVLVLFAICGFWGGAILQKHHDKSTVTTAAAGAGTGAAAGAAGAARRAAGGTGGTGGFGGFGGAAGGAGATGARTVGTVTDVEGTTVFLTDSSGNIVKVNLAPTTKITKTTSGTPADIQLGQTMIVTGPKGTDGSTSASTITLTPAAPAGAAPGAAGTGAGTGTGTGGTGTGG
jgi:hypothetical protein